jgi:hypothetical protein
MDQDHVISPCSRELAVRTSNGTQVRLLWREGTRQLWVEVWEPATAWALRIEGHRGAARVDAEAHTRDALSISSPISASCGAEAFGLDR